VVVFHLSVGGHFLFIPGDVYLIISLRLITETVSVWDRKHCLTMKVASYIVIHRMIVYDRVRRHVVFCQWVLVQTKKPCQNASSLPVFYFIATQITLNEN